MPHHVVVPHFPYLVQYFWYIVLKMDSCESEDYSILTDNICEGLARVGKIIGDELLASPGQLVHHGCHKPYIKSYSI